MGCSHCWLKDVRPVLRLRGLVPKQSTLRHLCDVTMHRLHLAAALVALVKNIAYNVGLISDHFVSPDMATRHLKAAL